MPTGSDRSVRVTSALVLTLTTAIVGAVAWGNPCAARADSRDSPTPLRSAATTPPVSTQPTGSVSTTGSVVPTPPVTPITPVKPKPKPAPKPVPKPVPDRTWMRRFYGRRVHRIVTTRRAIALTFDDGPTRLTKKTVQILDRYGAKGTFFVTGYCSRSAWASAANRYTVARGHELANHTEHHKGLRRNRTRCLNEILTLERLLKQQTGRGTTWVRAMGGNIDRVGLKATAQTGHLYAQWSTDSWDAKRLYTPPYLIYGSVVNHVRPGSIVLLHLTHPESIRALPDICRKLKARGYKLVTLTELAKMGTAYP